MLVVQGDARWRMSTVWVELCLVSTCAKCGGTGRVEEYNPSGCDDDWQVTCPECLGTGIVVEYGWTELEPPLDGIEATA